MDFPRGGGGGWDQHNEWPWDWARSVDSISQSHNSHHTLYFIVHPCFYFSHYPYFLTRRPYIAGVEVVGCEDISSISSDRIQFQTYPHILALTHIPTCLDSQTLNGLKYELEHLHGSSKLLRAHFLHCFQCECQNQCHLTHCWSHKERVA